MDGEFVCEEMTGLTKGAVGGGNLLIMGRDSATTLSAAEAAVAAISAVPDVIMPFPGGIVRSGSKVGSKYRALPASTNEAYCPTLKGRVESALTPEVGSVLEIVIDGLTDAAVRAGMTAGLQAVCARGAAAGVVRVSAGNYGGKLGKFQYPLGEPVG
jgi:formylmethanofuran--tetrahydromethanopterin N-formyltransferase